MKVIYKIVCLFMLLPLFAGCNDTDDVAAIFTGKTWKLSFIARDGETRMYEPFWGISKEETIKKLSQANTYTIKFEGIVEGDVIEGKINGTTVTSNLSGTWSANAKNNGFNATIKGQSDNDKLAENFLEGINAAASYQGDENNLYLIYKNSKGKFRMFFRVVK